MVITITSSVRVVGAREKRRSRAPFSVRQRSPNRSTVRRIALPDHSTGRVSVAGELTQIKTASNRLTVSRSLANDGAEGVYPRNRPWAASYRQIEASAPVGLIAVETTLIEVPFGQVNVRFVQPVVSEIVSVPADTVAVVLADAC
jgi:hypothetical protein